MKAKIEIEIENLKVSKHGSYSFDWYATVNGKKKKGNYNSSYSGQSSSAIRGKLKRGYAIELAVEQLIKEI